MNRLLVLLTVVAAARTSWAIPAFARRTEMSCTSCHQFQYPRLNSFGRLYQERGYRLPEGAEDAVRAKRTLEPGTLRENLAVFKEAPLSFRGQVFGVAPFDAETQNAPAFENKIFAFLMGGGSIADRVSFFFSWTPYPTNFVHHAHAGVHDIADAWLGKSALNFRAGLFMLLDFQRPSHRFLAPGPDRAGVVSVGLNRFTLEDPTLGMQLYGRPREGPIFYEIAVVAGDPGTSTERDDWKDIFARVAYTWFQHTSHELRTGLFGYLGRSDIETSVGGVNLAQRDDFWIAGAEAEADFGPVNLGALGYFSRHADALPEGGAVEFAAIRAQATWGITSDWVASVRYEDVLSNDDPSLRGREIAPHVSYLIATNVVAQLVSRVNLRDADQGDVVLVLDLAF